MHVRLDLVKDDALLVMVDHNTDFCWPSGCRSKEELLNGLISDVQDSPQRVFSFLLDFISYQFLVCNRNGVGFLLWIWSRFHLLFLNSSIFSVRIITFLIV